MDLFSLLILALALSMDAFAVAVSRGVSSRRRRGRDCLYTALAFGGAQALMPAAGFCFGEWLANDLIKSGGEAVAAGILALLGVKMVFEALTEKGNGGLADASRAGGARILGLQALATSIDALAVGIGLCSVSGQIVFPALVIGSVTFLVCCTGFLLGKGIQGANGQRAELIGGVVLILLAVKTLFHG